MAPSATWPGVLSWGGRKYFVFPLDVQPDVRYTPGMVKMTISVPDELREDMDSLADPPVWSHVAAEAFRQAVNEAKAKQKVQNMQDVIDRMKAAKSEEESELDRTFRENGRRWAREQATPATLRRLEALDTNEIGCGFPDHLGWFGVVSGRLPDADEMDSSEHREFIEEWICGEIDWSDVDSDDTPACTIAFIEGALEVWDTVRDHV